MLLIVFAISCIVLIGYFALIGYMYCDVLDLQDEDAFVDTDCNKRKK